MLSNKSNRRGDPLSEAIVIGMIAGGILGLLIGEWFFQDFLCGIAIGTGSGMILGIFTGMIRCILARFTKIQ